MIAWRGVVFNGEVRAWPTILMTHNEAFAVFPPLAEYTARWRQWKSGGAIDFDNDVTPEDRALVERWVANAS